MTVVSSNYRTDYEGNDVATGFAYDFKIQADTDLLVVLRDADGVETTLILNTDYTVSGVGQISGGQVDLTTAPATDEHLTITRNPPDTQLIDIRNQSSVSRETLEEALDKRTMVSLKQQSEIDRAIKIPVTDTSISVTLPVAEDRALKTLGFDADGNVTAIDSITSGGAVSSAMLPVTTSSTLALARSAMGPWTDVRGSVSVTDYGAVGNGVTDDTVAIRNALSAAVAASKNLFFPPGTYLMNGDGSYDEVTYGLIYISSSQIGIIGSGRGVTTIKCGSGTKSGIRISGATKARVGGFTLDMNGSTGFGVYLGGQYCSVSDIAINGVSGTRANDTVVNSIALVIPGSTLCTFDRVMITACANGVYAGFSGVDPSAPCQFLIFNDLHMDPSTDGFSVRVKYGNTITFNRAYFEGAPTRIIDLISCTGVYFNDLSAEIIGDYPLTTNSQFLVTACQNVKFNGVRILYSTGAPANKNIWELGGACELFSLRDVLVHIRENIGEIIKTTATQDMVLIDGLYVKPVVGGKTCTAITTGAFYNFNAKTVQGAPIKPTGTHAHITSAFCDVYLTTGASSVLFAEVGSSDWKIYIDAVESTGSRYVSYVPAASNQTSFGGKHVAEYFEVGSYFLFGNGIKITRTTGATPESSVTAPTGSLCVSDNGGAGKLWLKASGSGNTGWTQIT